MAEGIPEPYLVLYGTVLSAGDSLDFQLEAGRRGYVHVARGKASVNGQALNPGDGLMIGDQEALRFEGIDPAEILLFDLP